MGSLVIGKTKLSNGNVKCTIIIDGKKVVTEGYSVAVCQDKATAKALEGAKEVIVEEDKSSNERVSREEYEQILLGIKGIGKKTVKDIISTYPYHSTLVKSIEEDAHLPFNDSVSNKLKKEVA